LEKAEKEKANGENQLANAQFLAKAPAEVVDKLRARVEELRVLIDKLKNKLDELG
jgi:valyl-tRNA synthetase